MQRIASRQRAVARATFESLEGRTLFALTVTSFVDPDSGAAGLRVIANPLPGTTNDTLTITEDPDAGTTQVTGTGLGVLNFGEIELWDIRMGGGNDAVTWNVTQDFIADNRSVSIDLGTGNDTLNYKMSGVGGGSNVLLDIAGDSGNDTIAVDANDLYTGSRVNVQIEAGSGDDHVTSVTQDLFNDFSQLDVDVDLGSGLNTLDVEIEAVDDRARATYDIKGGDSAGTQFDTVNMALTGQLNVAGRLAVNALLGAGNDQMTMDLSRFGILGESEIRVDMQGGFGDDVLTVRTNQSGAPLPVEGVLDINQVGGNGNDTLSVDLRKTAVFGDTDGIDLDGLLRVRQQGQAGNDTLNNDLLFTSGSTGGWADVLITGDRGKDTAYMSLVSTGSVSFVGGYALLDGGADSDTRGLIATNVLPSLKVQRFDSGPSVVQID